ncbi:MAG: MBL fold metallo-hydrolase [Simkaniaceae bacterium]|nr:MBL fold metallo-hydrolase [Simkaniaceae bacterium]
MSITSKPCGPYGTQAIIVECPETKEAVAIDPGQGSLSFFQSSSAHITRVLLTHSHWDHIADAHLLPWPIYVHPLDKGNLEVPGSDRVPLPFPIKGAPYAGLLQEGDKIQVGNLILIVLHTPGHSPGSVCFYLEKEHILIAGDTLFKGSYGRIDLPTGNPRDMEISLKRLATLPGDVVVYPGHGEKTTIKNEAWRYKHGISW